MRAVEWNKKEDLVHDQALRHLKVCEGRCLLLLLHMHSAHLEILGFPMGDAF